jgi:hypothetical protein
MLNYTVLLSLNALPAKEQFHENKNKNILMNMIKKWLNTYKNDSKKKDEVSGTV